jgi:hypothetical protein
LIALVWLIGLGASAACFLKGHIRNGSIALALAALTLGPIVVIGLDDPSEPTTEIATMLLSVAGFPLVALVSVALALPAAQEGSFAKRRVSVDADGSRRLASVPTKKRIRRALWGGAVGATPALTFTALALTTLGGFGATIVSMLQRSALLGIIIGCWVGFNWVTKPEAGDPAQSKEPDASHI